MNMTLDQEMELWENRANDEFGKALKKLIETTKKYFCEEENEYGFKSTPLSELTALYAVDGDRRSIYDQALYICENYDLMQVKPIGSWFRSVRKLLND